MQISKSDSESHSQHRGQRKKRDNDALNLEKFMSRAGPVMELVIEESEQLYYLKNKDTVSKRQAVELK